MRTKNESKATPIKIEKPRNDISRAAKAVAVSTWKPQPIPLTRAEIQKLVIDQIG